MGSDLTEATRPILWNISHSWFMYVLFVIALGSLFVGLKKKYTAWKEGKPDDERLADWGKRSSILIKELLLQMGVRNTTFPAIFHSLIFYSFIVLVITTTVVFFDADFGTNFFVG